MQVLIAYSSPWQAKDSGFAPCGSSITINTMEEFDLISKEYGYHIILHREGWTPAWLELAHLNLQDQAIRGHLVYPFPPDAGKSRWIEVLNAG